MVGRTQPISCRYHSLCIGIGKVTAAAQPAISASLVNSPFYSKAAHCRPRLFRHCRELLLPALFPLSASDSHRSAPHRPLRAAAHVLLARRLFCRLPLSLARCLSGWTRVERWRGSAVVQAAMRAQLDQPTGLYPCAHSGATAIRCTAYGIREHGTTQTMTVQTATTIRHNTTRHGRTDTGSTRHGMTRTQHDTT